MGKATQVVTDPGEDVSPEQMRAASGLATTRPRSLFVTEGRLRAAWEALTEFEVEHPDLSPDDVDAFLARYVDRKATVAARDEFADFVVEMEAFAAAKVEEAAALRKQSEAIVAGVERMKASAVRTMTALGIEELRGRHRLLKIKRSRGAVAIVNEETIPSKFWRVREDQDLEDARAIVRVIARLIQAIEAGPGASSPVKPEETVDGLVRLANIKLKAMEDRRRAVDKKAIQDAWREAGGDVRIVHVDEMSDEEKRAARAGGSMLVTAASEETGAPVPVVPGVVKDVTVSLEIK